MMKTILHPTDFSMACEDAFRLLCPIARELSAEIVVLHVVHPETCGGDGRLNEEIDHDSLLFQRCWQAYSRLREIARGISTSLEVKAGAPIQVISNRAKRSPCDMIALAAPFHDVLYCQYHCRVSEALIRISPCPVLCLHQSPFQDGTKRILADNFWEGLEIIR